MTPDARTFKGDARHLPLEDDSVDLALWSPPYFAMRVYGDHDDELGRPSSIHAYIESILACVRESLRVLRPGKSLFVNVADRYVNRSRVRRSAHQPGMHDRAEFRTSWAEAAARGEVLTSQIAGVKERSLALVPERLAVAVADAGYYVKAHNVWCKPFGVPDPQADDRTVLRHESLLHIAATPRVDAWLDGPTPSHFTMNPSQGGSGHPAPWPESIVEWVVGRWSRPGDVVLDAFAGSGTTGRVCARLHRRYVGVDLYDWSPAPNTEELVPW